MYRKYPSTNMSCNECGHAMLYDGRDYYCSNDNCPLKYCAPKKITPPVWDDPYYFQDPTISQTVELSRSAGGKFAGYTTFRSPDESYPIDSKQWARLAKGTWKRLQDITPEDVDMRDMIFPDNAQDKMSWRMVCEMADAALKVAETSPDDIDAMKSAAWSYLLRKQAEILPPEPEGTEPSPMISGGDVYYRQTSSVDADVEIPF